MEYESLQQQNREEIFDALDEDLYGLTIELSKIHLNFYPRDARVWLFYAKALTALSRFAEAGFAFSKSLENSPASFHHIIFMGQGLLAERRGAFSEAKGHYLQAIGIAPKHSGAHVYLGLLSLRCGDLKQAEKWLRDAIKCGGQSPERDEAYLNLGVVLVAQERYEEAAVCYRKAIDLDPDYEIAKQRLRDVENVLTLRRRN